MIFTGIGSRKTPEPYLYLMSFISVGLGDNVTLRSGAAKGADTAFENGSGKSEIYLPWKGFNDHQSELYLPNLPEYDTAIEIAKAIHPAWEKCSETAQKLHTRNVYQILGKNLDRPSDMVVCWTPDGANGYSLQTTQNTGGTATAINLAAKNNIPVFNILNAPERKNVIEVVGKKIIIDIVTELFDAIPDNVKHPLLLLLE